jgi:hypothetical protein
MAVSTTAIPLSDRTRSFTPALLAAAFAFRLVYGLSMPFWSEDERQVYLIGLRAFARGEWPHLGADVVWTGGQLPGALQGMLIRWPLSVWPVPEAPFVLLNILSFLALALFAWYLARRLPQVPRWLIWGGLLTCPWTLNFSTHIINTSYVLPGAVVFFVGFFEGLPALRRGIVPFAAAWAFMGAGLFWVMQIHMSWVLLPPYVLAAAIGAVAGRLEGAGLARGQAMARAVVGFAIGALVTGSLLLPTVARDGTNAGHMFGALTLVAQGPFGLLTIAARVLSFASFETLRFLGLTRADRVLLFWRQPWIAPFALVALAAGVAQPLLMAIAAFRRAASGAAGDWRGVRVLTGATILLVYASYFLSIRGPQAHAFYVVFPVAVLFAASCWQVGVEASGPRRRRWERVAAVVLGCGLILHTGLALDRWPRVSLYADRPLASAAILDKNDRYLGDRRDTLDALEDHRPRATDGVADPDAYLAARAADDLQIVRSAWSPVAGLASRFSLTIVNRSRVAAWLDTRYTSTFTDASGRVVATHDGVIKQILQPGETRAWPDVADGDRPEGAVAATIVITGAERVIPVRRR